MTRSEAARHASLVRWGKENPLAARLAAIRERRKTRGGGKGKGKAKGKAKQTPEQRQQEQDATRQKNLQSSLTDLDFSADEIASLEALATGGTPTDTKLLERLGIAERGDDGTLRLTSQGRALYSAAGRGDKGAVRDALSRARDSKGREIEHEQKQTEKEAKEKEKQGKGGGGGDSSKDKEKTDDNKDAEKEQAKAQKKTENRQKVGEQLAENDADLSARGLEALTSLTSGDEIDESLAEGLVTMGLAEKMSDGSYRASSLGRQAARAAERGDYGATVDAVSRAKERKAKGDEQESEKKQRQKERRQREDERRKKEDERRKKEDGDSSGDDDGDGQRKPTRQTTTKGIDVMSDYSMLIEDLTDLATELTDLAHADDGAVKAGRRNSMNDQATINQGYDLAMQLCDLFEALGADVREEEGEAEASDDEMAEMMEGKSINYDASAQLVRDAWVQQMKPGSSESTPSPWPQAVFDDGVIISQDGCLYFIPYERTAEGITFADRTQWRMARQTYITADGEVKAGQAVICSCIGQGGIHPHDSHCPASPEYKAQRTFGGKKRDDLDDSDFAGPNRTYPIVTAQDVKDAARLIGKADDPEAVKRKIIAIAKRKGFADAIPVVWQTSGMKKGIEYLDDTAGEAFAVYAGSGVKAIGSDDGWVGGYLVRFGGDGDLSEWRDVFSKSTDFGRAIKSDVYVHHRLLPGLGKRRLTNQAEIGMDDEGVFIKHLLNLRSSYERKLYGMVQADKLGWSSGTAPHLIERKALGDGRHAIEQWPLGLDASYTPMPAGGLGVEAQVSSMKSLLADAGIDLLHAIYDNPEADDSDERERADALKATADRKRRLRLQAQLLRLQE